MASRARRWLRRYSISAGVKDAHHPPHFRDEIPVTQRLGHARSPAGSSSKILDRQTSLSPVAGRAAIDKHARELPLPPRRKCGEDPKIAALLRPQRSRCARSCLEIGSRCNHGTSGSPRPPAHAVESAGPARAPPDLRGAGAMRSCRQPRRRWPAVGRHTQPAAAVRDPLQVCLRRMMHQQRAPSSLREPSRPLRTRLDDLFQGVSGRRPGVSF